MTISSPQIMNFSAIKKVPSDLPNQINNIENPKKSDFSISPSFLTCQISNKKIYLIFENVCFSPNSAMFINVKYDQNELRNKLLQYIDPKDKKYITLESFTTSRSRFCFDINKWLDDSFKHAVPYKTFGSFQRTFKLRKQIPSMFGLYAERVMLKKYIDNSFKEYVKKHPELRREVFGIITAEVERALEVNSVNMFDYSYDYNSNTVLVSLKTIYTSMVMAWIMNGAKSKKNVSSLNFDKNVKDFLSYNLTRS